MISKIDKVNELENLVLNEKQIELELNHKFHDGMYIREMFIPKGVLLVGKRHRNETINMLIKGTMTIIEDSESFTISAPYTFIGSKFSKKAGYAHEDSIWVNIIRTDITNLEEIEKNVIIEENDYINLIDKDKICIGI